MKTDTKRPKTLKRFCEEYIEATKQLPKPQRELCISDQGVNLRKVKIKVLSWVLQGLVMLARGREKYDS